LDFIIPEQVLKPDKWNSISIVYQRGSNTFDLKVNKSYFDEPTRMPIRNLNNETEYNIAIDTRKVVER